MHGIARPSLLKLENQDDMRAGALRRLIEALGGRMEIIAHLPRGDIRIRQFQEASSLFATVPQRYGGARRRSIRTTFP